MTRNGRCVWATGVMCVPRRFDDLLPQTLHNLCDAGFDSPRLFADGANEDQSLTLKRTYGLEVTARWPNLRTHGNWLLSMYELYIREPAADYYAMFQDDFVTYPNLREYLESCEYRPDGYWNLYTFPKNYELCPKDYTGWYESNQKGLGAVALVFNRKALEAVVTSEHMFGRPQNAIRGHKAVDGGIVTSMAKKGFKEYVHNPSLVQHTGIVSSMRNRRHPDAPNFYGADYDARQLIGLAQ